MDDTIRSFGATHEQLTSDLSGFSEGVGQVADGLQKIHDQLGQCWSGDGWEKFDHKHRTVLMPQVANLKTCLDGLNGAHQDFHDEVHSADHRIEKTFRRGL